MRLIHKSTLVAALTLGALLASAAAAMACPAGQSTCAFCVCDGKGQIHCTWGCCIIVY